MTKLLFIIFQCALTNLKTWNNSTKTKFLNTLKELGSVYTYPDKTHHGWHYDKSNPEYNEVESSAIDIDLSYVRPNTHIRPNTPIKLVYDALKTKYKNIEDYHFIPIGWSAGCYIALYFAQVYSMQCIHVILLDSAFGSPNNMKLRFKGVDDRIYPITNAKYKKMRQDWPTTTQPEGEEEDADNLNNLNNYIRLLFSSRDLKLELPVPPLACVTIPEPAKADDVDTTTKKGDTFNVISCVNCPIATARWTD